MIWCGYQFFRLVVKESNSSSNWKLFKWCFMNWTDTAFNNKKLELESLCAQVTLDQLKYIKVDLN